VFSELRFTLRISIHPLDVPGVFFGIDGFAKLGHVGNIDVLFPFVDYPLVNTRKAIEHGHL
jgi:hypothetical protein